MELDRKSFELAKQLGLSPHDDNVIYEMYIHGRHEEAIDYIVSKTNCSYETAKPLFEGLMKGRSVPTPQQIAAVNLYEAQRAASQVTCPYCHSNDTKKISFGSKAGSVALFGIFGMGKASKQWHCNSCKSDF